MKILSIFITILFSSSCLADLYLQTEYQEGRKAKIITKHHIYLEKRHSIYYGKKHYVLILKKVQGDEVSIETESYDVDKKGNRTQQGGSFGRYKIGKSFVVTDLAPNGVPLFTLKIVLEKYLASNSFLKWL